MFILIFSYLGYVVFHYKYFVRSQCTTINPLVSHKFLGVIFDQELHWKLQVENVDIILNTSALYDGYPQDTG